MFRVALTKSFKNPCYITVGHSVKSEFSRKKLCSFCIKDSERRVGKATFIGKGESIQNSYQVVR